MKNKKSQGFLKLMQTKGLYPVPRIETTRLLNILKGIATILIGTYSL